MRKEKGQLETYVEEASRTNLGVAVAFEQVCHSNNADVVVPQDMPFLLFAGDLESVLKDCRRVRFACHLE